MYSIGMALWEESALRHLLIKREVPSATHFARVNAASVMFWARGKNYRANLVVDNLVLLSRGSGSHHANILSGKLTVLVSH